MKGIITKVECIDEVSDFNTPGEDHHIEFDDFPKLRERFMVFEKDRGLKQGTWATSVVKKLEVLNEKTTVVTTTYSVYILTTE